MVKLSMAQVYRFAFVYLYSEPISFLIQRLFKMSAYQGWLSVLGGFSLSLIVLAFTVQLGRTFPDRGWVDFGGDIIGQFPHRVVLVLVGLYALFLAAIDVQNFVTFLRTIYLPDTPVWMVTLLTVLCIALTSRQGLLTIVYMAEGVFIIQVVASMLVFPAIVEGGQRAIIQTMVTHHEVRDILFGSLSTMPWFSEWGLFLFLAPLTSFLMPIGRALMLGGLSVVIILIVYWLLILMNFGPYVSEELQYPLLELIRFARYSDFMSNLDPLLIAFWSTTMFMRTSFQVYVASMCLSRVTGIQDHKPLVFIAAATLAAIVLQYSADTLKYETAIRTYAVATNAMVMDCFPILYLMIYWFRYGAIPKNRPVPVAKPPP